MKPVILILLSRKGFCQAKKISGNREATVEFLKNYDLSAKVKDTLINAVYAHHGAIPFISVESEICANADCYRFAHPKGVLFYLTTLAKRLDNFDAIIN